jgi:hypothetical protein
MEAVFHARDHYSKEGQPRDASPMRQGSGPTWHARDLTVERVPGSDSGLSHPAAPPPADGQHTVPQAPQEDAVAMQERIMKEKRLEARQRRLEQ